MTKTQRKAKAARSARKRRLAKAATALFRAMHSHRANPGKKIQGFKLRRLKGGGLSMIPVKAAKKK